MVLSKNQVPVDEEFPMATWPSTRVFRVSLGGHLAFAVHQAAASSGGQGQLMFFFVVSTCFTFKPVGRWTFQDLSI